jgi:serine/threonine-protein kinase HipA
MKHIEKLLVSLNGVDVGTLHLGERGKIYFSYNEQWLKNGFNISPFDLKMTPDLQTPRENLFSNLHGVFADSISDGWGLMLTDRALQKEFKWEKSSISQLDRLYFIGSRSMGGLEYFPHDKTGEKVIDFNIEDIFHETQQIMHGDKDDIVKELYLSGGSPGGARPKAVFARNNEKFITGYGDIPDGYEGWIIKFFSSTDSANMGRIEKAYADMAKDCSIIMPDTDLIDVVIDNKKHSFFAIKRFDRIAQERIHIASLSGLVYASHRLPSVGYKDIFNVTRALTKNKPQSDILLNVMLFNVLMHNQDDHSKNFSYQCINNEWQLTPSYDLVYSVGPGGEHMTDVVGNGKPTYKDVKKLAQQYDIKNIDEQIEKMIDVSQNWKKYADKYDIPTKETNAIKKSLATVLDRFSYHHAPQIKKK